MINELDIITLLSVMAGLVLLVVLMYIKLT